MTNMKGTSHRSFVWGGQGQSERTIYLRKPNIILSAQIKEKFDGNWGEKGLNDSQGQRMVYCFLHLSTQPGSGTTGNFPSVIVPFSVNDLPVLFSNLGPLSKLKEK